MQVLTADKNVTFGPDWLASGDNFRIVHLVLPKGKEIKRHRSEMSVTVVCIKGEIEFHTDNEVTTLVPGKALMMTPDEWHWLEAPNQGGEVIVVQGKLAANAN